MSLKNEAGVHIANATAGGMFAMTLANVDTVISIVLGVMGLVAACYSIVWQRIKIKQAQKEKNDE